MFKFITTFLLFFICFFGFSQTNKKIVAVNPKFYRPAEVELLIGNPIKAKQELNWEPKTTLEELCQMMIEADTRRNIAGTTY